jgi:hypothetical protein
MSPLEQLRWITNNDKHRRIQVVTGDTGDFMDRLRSDAVVDWNYESATDGALLMRVEFRRTDSRADDLPPGGPIHLPAVTVSDGGYTFPVIQVLGNIMLRVQAIVAEMEDHLRPNDDSRTFPAA